MEFLNRLRRYLALSSPDTKAGGCLLPSVDFAARRRHVLSELASLEAEAESEERRKRIAELHSRCNDEWIQWFAGHSAILLLESVAPQDAAELAKLLDEATTSYLGTRPYEEERAQDVLSREVARVTEEAAWPADARPQPPEWHQWSTVAQYALEIRAVRRNDNRDLLTEVGAVVRDLSEVDCVRWLLHLEAAQSVGLRDAWRLSREAAAVLLERPQQKAQEFPFWPFEMDDLLPLPLRTIERLHEFDVLEYQIHEDDEAQVWSYRVHESAKPLLTEVAEATENPFSLLAQTLSGEEAERVMDRAQPRRVERGESTVAATQARYARMVAHEIRNALVPVQETLSRLYRNIGGEPGGDALGRYRERIDDGLDRVFSFVDQMLSLASAAGPGISTIFLDSAIRDALEHAAAGNDRIAHVKVQLGEDLPAVSGAQERLTLAITNLVRNALQTGGDELLAIRIAAVASEDRKLVRITVDDDGPGVPEGQRARIFEEGVSLTPGGAGFGLAIVRDVVEREMGGRVSCEANPDGGARFTLSLPALERS